VTSGRGADDNLLEVGDEVRGNFRCTECDLFITSPKESDGILVLPVCSLCGSTEWRRAGAPR
jgi:hypothetical protein